MNRIFDTKQHVLTSIGRTFSFISCMKYLCTTFQNIPRTQIVGEQWPSAYIIQGYESSVYTMYGIITESLSPSFCQRGIVDRYITAYNLWFICHTTCRSGVTFIKMAKIQKMNSVVMANVQKMNIGVEMENDQRQITWNYTQNCWIVMRLLIINNDLSRNNKYN